MGHNRHLDIEQRGANGLAEQILVALVIRMRNESNTGWQQLWSGGFDENLAVRTVET